MLIHHDTLIIPVYKMDALPQLGSRFTDLKQIGKVCAGRTCIERHRVLCLRPMNEVNYFLFFINSCAGQLRCGVWSLG